MAEPLGKRHNVVLKSKSRSVVSNSLQPHGLYSPWNSPGKNTGVDSLFLLQGIFPIQGLNPGLSHCRQILYQLSHNCSIKRNKILVHAPTWINFKNMLSQRSQTQNTTFCIFHLCEISRKNQVYRQKVEYRQKE